MFAAEVSIFPIAVAMVVGLAAFAAGLPALIRDSRLPPRPRPAKPIVIREPRPVKPSRQLALPVAMFRANTSPPRSASPPPGTPAPTRRAVVAATTLVVLSIWSTRLVRTRPSARR